MSTNTSTPEIPAIAETEAEKWGYLSLIFSLFYFLSLYAGWQHYQTNEVILAFVGYVGFLVLYIWATRKSGQEAIIPVASLIAISTLIATFHVGANALFGYASFLASYYFSKKIAHYFLWGNLAAQILVALIFDKFHIYFLGPSLVVTVSLFFYGRFSQKEFIFQIRENEKNQKIEQLAAIAERERIARDMHDLLGHTLSSLALKSELAEKLMNHGSIDQAKTEISQVAELARRTLSEVRAAVTDLKQKGLPSTVNALCNELEHMGFKAQSHIDVGELNAKLESTLIMLCKEAITNILRHSNANQVNVAIHQSKDTVNLRVEDNGSLASAISAGNGINGMKMRTEQLKGTFTLDTTAGVTLEFSLPIHS